MAKKKLKKPTITMVKSKPVTETKGLIDTDYVKDAEVVIGHLPIGIHQVWNVSAPQVQYVSFFRDPLQKLVSGYIFANQNREPTLTEEDVVNEIKALVIKGRSKGSYAEGYSAYLLTPEQKLEVYSHKKPLSFRIELVLQNLVQNKVICGILERMPESLELLQFTLDKRKALGQLFNTMTGNGTSREVRANVSYLSTTKVVGTILNDKDEGFLSQLKEYLKYDEAVYRFAIATHEKQLDWVRATTGIEGVKFVRNK